MSADTKNASSPNDKDDPLFDALTDDKTNSADSKVKPAEKTESSATVEPIKPKAVTSSDSEPSGFKHFLKEKITRKEFIFGSIIFVLLLGGAIAFGLTHMAGAPTAQKKVEQPKKAVVYYSPLTGSPVLLKQTKWPVTAVMIENSEFARPQSGLKEAGVVFEAIAEAGITRFMALYQEATPHSIGPVRSARPYYVQWAQGFDAAYAHVGGSPEALADIIAWHVKDMNEFAYGGYYHRVSYREPPHNMYTSINQLSQIEKKNGWKTSKFTGFKRKNQAPAKKVTARQINFNISWSDYHVYYRYDPKYNAYKRWEGGAPHIDAKTKQQLEPKVVIGMVMPYSIEGDGYHSMYKAIGSGRAFIFQDGKYIIGKWNKVKRESQIVFTDSTGKPVALNRGQTWITALAHSSDASYKP